MFRSWSRWMLCYERCRRRWASLNLSLCFCKHGERCSVRRNQERRRRRRREHVWRDDSLETKALKKLSVQVRARIPSGKWEWNVTNPRSGKDRSRTSLFSKYYNRKSHHRVNNTSYMQFRVPPQWLWCHPSLMSGHQGEQSWHITVTWSLFTLWH